MDRTAVAVLSTDALLSSLGLDRSRRLALYARRVADRTEAGADYRRRKTTLRRLLGDPAVAGGLIPKDIARVLRAQAAELAPLGDRLAVLARRGELSKPVDRICEGIAHMHRNRLRSADGPNENRLLGLLLRTLEGLTRAPVG